MTRSFWVLALLAGMAAVCGCGSGPKKYDVSGEVSYDGQPVEDGFITFVPKDPAVAPEAAPVQNGRYSCKVPAGTHKVEITATKKTPGKGPMGEDYVVVSLIPDKYNTQSTLTAEVGPGKTQHDFPLKK